MHLSTPFTLLLIYLLVNVVVYCVYWWDKQAAIEGAWRVRESTLLWLAIAGGSLGALTAQQVLRHKTRKEPFRSILMTIGVLHVGLGIVWITAPNFVVEALSRMKASI
ncbi:uncharacterized membrane protein YsdA (DUF1294 family) [Pararhizobium capsulatum DSM 1112]|uniref:Uncharacterized membrane protein YsdA (DUF1294 family) n=1 Tax=Pararhizobium capsulatum DSM 1112 TaxID=1121113 RepID=A0ABU0C3H5_9HYPH|nr:DUF1294 domain-containing protein [Pararhizobium capsulatum]MDQ0323632.1 uncharacterized membrane protein YsdA (DUF1294 family) [Pararhizobium capsulatum DSM 1112]